MREKKLIFVEKKLMSLQVVAKKVPLRFEVKKNILTPKKNHSRYPYGPV